jgi:hypothetical protein
LPPAERRRTGQPVKLAIAVGLEALAQAGQPAEAAIPTIFTSSGGDGAVVHEICEALAQPEREVSPTRFHNSVHNASAGYWSIALRTHAPSTSLCAYDWSFAAGLVEAATQLLDGHDTVMLISYDVPYPEPLARARPVEGILGVALVLSRNPTANSLGRLDLLLDPALMTPTQIDVAGLQELNKGNPTGRALPLLQALASRSTRWIALDYLGTGTVTLRVAPVSKGPADPSKC